MIRIEAGWLRAARPQRVCALLGDAGHQVLFVGGCVRNTLLERPVSDIDLATDARPETVMALADAAGVRAVPTGVAHGTVTLVLESQPFEITTFRRDVETDGRHAVVHYTDQLAEDAARRDFTMNALYARRDGCVVDPLGGLPDLRAGRVRFVGAPAERIAEDHLRILRFFRFHAWYGDQAAGLDAEGLAACAAARDGVARLSRERVGTEVTRLLAAPDPAPALAAMSETDVLARVLPGADARCISRLVAVERAGGYVPSWQRRLAALGQGEAWADALRLARADQRRLRETWAALAAGEPPAAAAYRHGAEVARDAALVDAACRAVPPPERLDAGIERGAHARFPVRAADLDLHGHELGTALRRLEAAWIASGFALSRAALLELEPDR